MSEDKYVAIRSIPLRDVLAMCGFTKWKSRKGGREFYGACPFHKPKHNKTSFSFDERRFNCFSCGESGSGSIDLLMKLKGVGFQEAVNVLGGATVKCVNGVVKTPLTQNTLNTTETEPNVVLENKPFSGSYEKFYVKSDWLKARGLTEETLKVFGVGQYFNPSRKSVYSNKVLFPVRRFSDGEKVGYLARTIEKDSTDPKYIFPKGFHKQLEVFGAWQIKQHASNGAAQALPLRVGFVVESPLCVMKYWQMGLYAVSPFGAFLSSEQVEIVAQLFRGVVYLPDRDKYEQVAPTVQTVSARLWVKTPHLPEGIDDPERLEREQVLALLKSMA